MRLTTITHVTLDGVVQGLGGPDEDRRGGFDRGGWALPLFAGEAEAHLVSRFQEADAFLFGRWTFEVFAASWGTVTDPAPGGIAEALNGRPKHVVSRTLDEPRWAGASVLRGAPETEVHDLKRRQQGELQVHGSASLVRFLLQHGLVDEMVIYTYPLVIGQGRRLFPSEGRDLAMEVMEHRAFTGGVTVQRLRVAGRPSYAPVAPFAGS